MENTDSLDKHVARAHVSPDMSECINKMCLQRFNDFLCFLREVPGDTFKQRFHDILLVSALIQLRAHSKRNTRGIEPTLNVLMAVYLNKCGDTFKDNQSIKNSKVRAKQPDFYINNDWTLNVKTFPRPMTRDKNNPSELRAKKPWLLRDIDNEVNNTDAYLLMFIEESLDHQNL